MRCPQSAQTADQAQILLKKQLQWLLFLRVVFLSVLLGVSALLQGKNHPLVLPPLHFLAYFVAVIYLFTIASAVLLRCTACYRRLTWIQIIMDVLSVSCLVLFSGISQSMFVIVYFFPIIAGGFMLFRVGGLLTASLGTILYGALLSIEYLNPVLPPFFQVTDSPPPFETMLHSFAVNGLSFFLVALLTAALAERLHKVEAALSLTASNYDRLAMLYKQIFDDIATGIITVDGDGLITSFNRAAETITGYQAHEVLGRPIADPFPGLGTTGHHHSRLVGDLRRKDGETIPVGYSWARLNSPDDCENCLVFTMQDLSRIRQMEAQVRQSEKMAAIGEMAAGIAHEFRNPLAAISGSAQLLGQQLTDHAASQKLTEIINRECDRLETVIREFLQFSRPASPDKKWFCLEKLVRETLLVFEQTPEGNKKVEIRIDIPDDLECWADSDQIKQILLNFLSNSFQALGNSPHGTITIHAREERENGVNRTLIHFKDNGPGIALKNKGKIFEPYFTGRKNGTGLGLAVVHQLVKSHDGTISAYNGTDGGANFLITLPLAET